MKLRVFSSVILSSLFLLLLFTIHATGLPAHAENLKDNTQNLRSLLSEPGNPNFTQKEHTFNLTSPPLADRLVIQIINNTLYSWYEYDLGSSLHIYQVEPVTKWLNLEETSLLLELSRKWEEQFNKHFNQELTGATLKNNPAFRTENMVDNRTAIKNETTSTYPYNTIGYLDITFPESYMRGSAFLISPYTALTNAHNVYVPAKGGWCESISFSPGQYETLWPETVKPYGTTKAINIETNQNYLLYTDLNDEELAVKHDYAALFFNQPFSNISTFMPLQFNYIPGQVKVIGYPSVVRSADTMGMWSAEGSIIHHDSHCLYYDAYTNPGTSGSPVLVYNQQHDTYRVVAIHTFAAPDQYSGGPHLNSQNRNLIEEWIKWIPGSTDNNQATITLSENKLELKTGEKQALIATVESPDNDTGFNIYWSSSNTTVAKVDANGVVTAINGGSAIITVELLDYGQMANCTVYVATEESSQNKTTDQYADIELIKGDLTGNRSVNVLDVTMAMKYTIGLEDLNDKQIYNADVNNDGVVNVLDVTLMMRYTLGIIDSF